jgi:peroxin-13
MSMCLPHIFLYVEYQPKIRGWLLGSIDGLTQGIMPANYLKIMGKKQGESCIKIGNVYPVPTTCPTSTEPAKSADKLEAIFEEKTF